MGDSRDDEIERLRKEVANLKAQASQFGASVQKNSKGTPSNKLKRPLDLGAIASARSAQSSSRRTGRSSLGSGRKPLTRREQREQQQLADDIASVRSLQ